MNLIFVDGEYVGEYINSSDFNHYIDKEVYIYFRQEDIRSGTDWNYNAGTGFFTFVNKSQVPVEILAQAMLLGAR